VRNEDSSPGRTSSPDDRVCRPAISAEQPADEEQEHARSGGSEDRPMATVESNSIQTKNLDRPDETRTPDKTSVNVVRLGDATVARLTVQPGWSWAECIRPVVGGESCQAAHLGYVVSGRLHVTADDGAEGDLNPGDGYRLTPGHNAQVVGDEPFVALEFESTTADTYAKG
jgi:hypothetical protein